VTRPARGTRAKLADQFAANPVETVVAILRRAGSPMTAADVMDRLRSGGVPDERRAWKRVQPKLAAHPNVVTKDRTYAWADGPAALTPTAALDLLAVGRVSVARRKHLAELVRAALAGQAPDPEEAARRRQAGIDAVRALAELAAEVEELTVNEVDPPVLIRQVRAWVKRSGLEPVDRAGEPTTFDRNRHKPISASIRDGAPVIVVRPGYVWKAPTEDLLVVRPVVEE
jgi:hypothetical protein